MHWLRENAFLAAWIALPVAIGMGIYQNRLKTFREMDWPRFLMYITFLSCLAAALTPYFDSEGRSFARYIAGFLLGAIIVNRQRL